MFTPSPTSSHTSHFSPLHSVVLVYENSQTATDCCLVVCSCTTDFFFSLQSASVFHRRKVFPAWVILLLQFFVNFFQSRSRQASALESASLSEVSSPNEIVLLSPSAWQTCEMHTILRYDGPQKAKSVLGPTKSRSQIVSGTRHQHSGSQTQAQPKPNLLSHVQPEQLAGDVHMGGCKKGRVRHADSITR